MPQSLSHYSLEGEYRGRDEKVSKYRGDGLLGYGDDEVRESREWEERGGELVVWLVKFAWIRASVQAGLLGHPDHLISKMQAKKRMAIIIIEF